MLERRLVKKLFTLVLLSCLSAFSAVTGFAQERIYWENPRYLDLGNPRFPQFASSFEGLTVLSHHYEFSEGQQGNAYISISTSSDGIQWQDFRNILGPFPFTGAETPISSLLVRPDGEILVAVAEGQNAVGIYRFSGSSGRAVRIGTVETPLRAVVAPRLYATADGGLMLFVSRDASAVNTGGGYLGIFFSTSSDGRSWSSFEPLVRDNTNLRETYLPALASLNGRDYVVFQAFKMGGSGGNPPSTYQLYLTTTADRGQSWSSPVLLTSFNETHSLGSEPGWEYYDNQRPSLYSNSAGNRLFLSWERRSGRSRVRNIYLSELGAGGNVLTVSRLNSNRDSISPRFVQAGDRFFVSWYEGGEQAMQVRLAEGRTLPGAGLDWYYDSTTGYDYLTVDTLQNSSAFAVPAVFEDRLYLVWESDTYRNDEINSSRLIVRGPDISVPVPSLRGGNFTAGQPASLDTFRVAWTEPRDPSGIAGYSYMFSRLPGYTPEKEVKHFRDESLATSRELTVDGNWYFIIIAQDYAGNWSRPGILPIIRDTTPPSPPQFLPPDPDDRGFLLSNTMTLSWLAPPEEDTSGYSYTFTLLSSSGRDIGYEGTRVPSPPERIITRSPEASFYNRDNGTWMISAAALDGVGNMSAPTPFIFRLNKYIPVTIIDRVRAERDEVGSTLLTIQGRGYVDGGLISAVILDQDGREPYDYRFPAGQGFFNIAGDRLIDNFKVEDIEEGNYRIGIEHPRRGLKWASSQIYFEPSGVVKFGDFTYRPPSKFRLSTENRLSISVNSLVTIMLLAGLALALGITVFKIRGVIIEGAVIRRDIAAIVAGGRVSSADFKSRMKDMRKRGLGLRIKFVLLITLLILIVVMMVAVSLGYYMIESRQKTLAEGLSSRAALLLESLAVGAQEPIDSNDQETILSLVSQVEAMSDATGVTITGRSAANPDGELHALWAASNPDELIDSLRGEIRIDYRAKNSAEDAPRTFALINADELSSYRDRFDVLVTPFYGRSIYQDELSPAESDLAERVDTMLSDEMGAIETDIRDMQQEQLILESLNRNIPVTAAQREFIRSRFPDFNNAEERSRRLQQLNEDVVRFNRSRRALIREAGNVVVSSPVFDVETFRPRVEEYTFYRPIVGFRQQTGDGEGSGYFYRGTVRLRVTTEEIVQQILDSRRTLITITAVVALIAAVIGIIGALILATIIIVPIRRLIRGVEVIRDTADKAALKGHEVETRTRDELYGLAQTINEMTHGLVEAAESAKELTLGKEIQKKFLPLEEFRERKLPTATFSNQRLDLYGYYEGADELSGDYFDHIDLQNGYRAIIKCDVSGHGVTAALIMVEVATIFTSYFNRLIGKKPNLNLSSLVGNINQLLVDREFKGRFAAFIIILMEEATGKLFICNAGDSLLNIFERNEGRVHEIQLSQKNPAAGSMDPAIFGPITYEQDSLTLATGDTLLLYTDGVEESRHVLRDSDYNVVEYQNLPGEIRKKDEEEFVRNGYKEVKVDETFEEFDPKRIREILETAYQRKKYILKRRVDTVILEPLEFDFSEFSGSPEDMVTVLIAVEKVFRLFPDPKATERDRVQVDKKIDVFLQKHFKGYYSYFRNRVEDKEYPEYVWFTHLKEDRQEDDLTMLAIQRK